jgi:hypothetical protein
MENALLEFEKGSKSNNARSLYAYGHFLSMLTQKEGYTAILKAAEQGYAAAEFAVYEAIQKKKIDEKDGRVFLTRAARHGFKRALELERGTTEDAVESHA